MFLHLVLLDDVRTLNMHSVTVVGGGVVVVVLFIMAVSGEGYCYCVVNAWLLVSWSVGRSVGRSVSWSVALSVGRLDSWTVGQLVSWLVGQSKREDKE